LNSRRGLCSSRLTTSTSNPVTAARCSGVHPPARARIIAPTAFSRQCAPAPLREPTRNGPLAAAEHTRGPSPHRSLPEQRQIHTPHWPGIVERLGVGPPPATIVMALGTSGALAMTFHPRPTPAVGSGRDPATTREWIRAAHRSPAAGHFTSPTRGRRARNGLPESTGKQGDRPLRVARPTGADAYPLLPGFIEGTGVGPQPDLVDHHRRHRDGVSARPRPLRVELFGHYAYLLEELGHAAGDVVDPGQ
jgi:hypothetical protein